MAQSNSGKIFVKFLIFLGSVYLSLYIFFRPEVLFYFRVISANLGSVRAQYNIGNYYFYGWHGHQDYEKAEEWYRRSANNGYPLAQGWLAMLYFNGRGVPEDEDTAVEFLQAASDSGKPKTLYRLAQECYTGKYHSGVFTGKFFYEEPDLVCAYMMTTMASEEGYKTARISLPEIKNELSSEQLREAQRRLSLLDD